LREEVAQISANVNTFNNAQACLVVKAPVEVELCRQVEAPQDASPYAAAAPVPSLHISNTALKTTMSTLSATKGLSKTARTAKGAPRNLIGKPRKDIILSRCKFSSSADEDCKEKLSIIPRKRCNITVRCKADMQGKAESMWELETLRRAAQQQVNEGLDAGQHMQQFGMVASEEGAEDFHEERKHKNSIRKKQRHRQNTLVFELDVLLPEEFRTKELKNSAGSRSLGTSGRSLFAVLADTVECLKVLRACKRDKAKAWVPPPLAIDDETLREGMRSSHSVASIVDLLVA
jgi:hypothetical protein